MPGVRQMNLRGRSIMYRMPPIKFPSYDLTAKQIREKVTKSVFSLYRPVLIALMAVDTAVASTMCVLAAYFVSSRTMGLIP